MLLFTGVASATEYLPAGFDLTAFLPPPPAFDTPQMRDELQTLHWYELIRTPDDIARAHRDVDETVFAFTDPLGAAFNPRNLPLTADYFDRARQAAQNAVRRAKDIYQRPRPLQVDSSLHPCLVAPAASAYPSGHGTLGWMNALLLADMLPERRGELMERGRAFGLAREICGIHWPSDTEAGRMSAVALIASLRLEPDIERVRVMARDELRRGLGLPAAMLSGRPTETMTPSVGDNFRTSR